MNFSVFSEYEIKARYARTPEKEKPELLRVLAELTASTEREMAEFLGVTIITNTCNRINNAKAYELYEKGLSDAAIAKEFGVTASSVREWRMTRGLNANVPKNNTKLPPNDVLMAAYNGGLTDKELSEKFCVGKTSICRWRYANQLSPNPKRRIRV